MILEAFSSLKLLFFSKVKGEGTALPELAVRTLIFGHRHFIFHFSSPDLLIQKLSVI